MKEKRKEGNKVRQGKIKIWGERKDGQDEGSMELEWGMGKFETRNTKIVKI